MSRYRHTAPTEPTWGVQALLEAGLPDGPLAAPQRFFRTRAGSKLHANVKCSRMRNSAMSVLVDFRTTLAEAYCSECVSGPTDTAAATYIEHAKSISARTRAFAQLCALVTCDTLGLPAPTPDEDADEAVDLLPAVDVLAEVEVTTATWERVGQADTILRALDDIDSHPQVYAGTLDRLAPLHAAVRSLRDRLRDVAGGAQDEGALVRSCVIDLLGKYGAAGYGHGVTPEDSRPQLKAASAYPALCTTGADYGARFSDSGFNDLVLESWGVWREEVRGTANLDTARAAVMASSRIPATAPKHVFQLNMGSPRTAMPASGSPWDWMVAEWRLAATEELGRVVGEWQEAYVAAMSEADTLPFKIAALEDWDTTVRSTVNASNRVLAQVPLELDAARTTGLAIVPGVVARWLQAFDVAGQFVALATYRKRTVRLVADARPADSSEMLRTIFLLWERSNHKPYQRPAFAKLETVIVAAQGIHAAA